MITRLQASSWCKLLAVLGIAVAAAVFVRVQHVHDQTWEWRLSSSSTPPKLVYAHRDYRRSDDHSTPPSGAGLIGHAAGGAALFSKVLPSYATTVIWVRTTSGYTVYELMGGP